MKKTNYLFTLTRKAILLIAFMIPIGLSAQQSVCFDQLVIGEEGPITVNYSVSDKQHHFEGQASRIHLCNNGLAYPFTVIYTAAGYITDTTVYTKSFDAEKYLKPLSVSLPDVDIHATRTPVGAPVPVNTYSHEDLMPKNLGVDLPILLDQATGVVTTSDAGAGVGYTGLRVRGSDATRVNVTVNGIPLNDAESQGVYWVDLPDIAASADEVQITRGIGTSTNGAGAFGATIAVQTLGIHRQPSVEINNSYGSFNTHKHSVDIASGLLNNHWLFDGRFSTVGSDGYVDRSGSQLRSYYMSGMYINNHTTIKALVFSGNEVTHQAWYGTPAARLNNDTMGMQEYIHYMGLSAAQSANLLNSDRRYNFYTYGNQVDDYTQTHAQLHWYQTLDEQWSSNIALHYTKGRGYFEEYQDAASVLSDANPLHYGLPLPVVGTDTLRSTDLIRRKWLDNDFYGITWALKYQSKANHNFQLIYGGGANEYIGQHYDEVIWMRYSAADLPFRYHDETARKTDVNTFLKSVWNYNTGSLHWTFFADLQYRYIHYLYHTDADDVQRTDNLHFFNPKLGATLGFDGDQSISAFAGIGNREPNRDDYVAATPGSTPKPETLYDLEAIYTWKPNPKWIFQTTVYGMFYHNELVPTGQLNDVGAYIRTNVDRSYRIGWETELTGVIPYLGTLKCNMAISRNRIPTLLTYIDNWDQGGQTPQTYSNTDIAFSPDIVGAASLTHDVLSVAQHRLSVTASVKYVGRQFTDNTSSEDRKINAYYPVDLGLAYTFKPAKGLKQIAAYVQVRNVFSQLYVSNGWAYRFYADGQYRQQDGYYPQAGAHIMAGVRVGF